MAELRIPLREERGKYTHLIGYYYPKYDLITTPKGNPSQPTIDGDKMHKKRVHAAYSSADFTYREPTVEQTTD